MVYIVYTRLPPDVLRPVHFDSQAVLWLEFGGSDMPHTVSVGACAVCSVCTEKNRAYRLVFDALTNSRPRE